MAILRGISLICPSCGNYFNPNSKGKNRPPQVYCSIKCFTPERTKRRSPPEGRFWKKVDKTGSEGCWNWTAGLNAFGYGAFGVGPRKIVAAHRYSFEIHNGKIPEGLSILHSCDNPKCVNPEHLRAGTKAENSKDMVMRNRSTAGEKSASSKLSNKDVLEIFVDPRSQSKIAKAYNVDASVISRIKGRKSWKHITR